MQCRPRSFYANGDVFRSPDISHYSNILQSSCHLESLVDYLFSSLLRPATKKNHSSTLLDLFIKKPPVDSVHKGPILRKCAECHVVPIQSLQWRHNERDSVSNHQPRECLLSRLIIRRSKKASKLSVTGEFRAQRASNAENVSIWWRHQVIYLLITSSRMCALPSRVRTTQYEKHDTAWHRYFKYPTYEPYPPLVRSKRVYSIQNCIKV